MIQSLLRVPAPPHVLPWGHLPLRFPPPSATLPGVGVRGALRPCPGLILRSTARAPALPASRAAGSAVPCSRPAPRGPPPPTGGLAHAQAEATGVGALPEVHRGKVLAGVGASGRAQPQREVPALEAALVQPHAGLQGRPPAAQAARSLHQHHVAARPGARRGGRRGARAGRGSRRAAGRERGPGLSDSRGEEARGKMQSNPTSRTWKRTQKIP